MTSLLSRLRGRSDAARRTPPAPPDPAAWSRPFDLLRSKWGEVPAGADRRHTSDLLALSDAELLDTWDAARRAAAEEHMFPVRGWYYTLYRDVLRDRQVADVGSGMGFDAITFAEAGARVVCADIVESNLRLIERVARLKGIASMDFVFLESFADFAKLPELDVAWCQGSMINAPFEVAREEAQHLLARLRTGGRWIELAYPEERWRREGCLSPTDWGDRTDGGAPWMEWYDLPKILRRLEPHRFEVVLAFNFHHDDFNWFDLLKIS